MIQFKNLTIEELKQSFSDRKGFVFNAQPRSSEEAINRLCEFLIAKEITDELPDFVVRLTDTLTAFVYNDTFDNPAFLRGSMIAMKMGICQVELLSVFLEHYENK